MAHFTVLYFEGKLAVQAVQGGIVAWRRQVKSIRHAYNLSRAINPYLKIYIEESIPHEQISNPLAVSFDGRAAKYFIHENGYPRPEHNGPVPAGSPNPIKGIARGDNVFGLPLAQFHQVQGAIKAAERELNRQYVRNHRERKKRKGWLITTPTTTLYALYSRDLLAQIRILLDCNVNDITITKTEPQDVTETGAGRFSQGMETLQRGNVRRKG